MAKAQGTVFTTSGAKAALKEFNQDYYGRRTWDSMFGTIGVYGDTATSMLSDQYSQSINDAYISAMRNNNEIIASNLGQGYKEELINNNNMALNDAFSQYRDSYLSGLNEIKSDVNDQVSQIDRTLTDEASNMAKYGNAHFDYVEWLYENNPDVFTTDMNWRRFLVEDSDGETRLKSYGELTGEMFDANGNLNDAGRAFLTQVDNYSAVAGGYSFGDYLAANDPGLFEWAQGADQYHYGGTTVDTFRKLTGNRTPGEYESTIVPINDARKKEASAKRLKELSSDYDDVVSSYDGKSKNKTETSDTLGKLDSAVTNLSDFVAKNGLLSDPDIKAAYDEFVSNYDEYANIINDPSDRKGNNRNNRKWAVSNAIADYEKFYNLVASKLDADQLSDSTKRHKDKQARKDKRDPEKNEILKQNLENFSDVYDKYGPSKNSTNAYLPANFSFTPGL